MVIYIYIYIYIYIVVRVYNNYILNILESLISSVGVSAKVLVERSAQLYKLPTDPNLFKYMIYLSINPLLHPSICTFIHPPNASNFIYMSIDLSVHSSIRSSIYPIVYLSIFQHFSSIFSSYIGSKLHQSSSNSGSIINERYSSLCDYYAETTTNSVWSW